MNIHGGTIIVPWAQKHNPLPGVTARETLFVISAAPPLNAAKIEAYLNERFVNGQFQGCTAITESSYASYESEVAIVIAKAKLPRIGSYAPICDKPEPKSISTSAALLKLAGPNLLAWAVLIFAAIAVTAYMVTSWLVPK